MDLKMLNNLLNEYEKTLNTSFSIVDSESNTLAGKEIKLENIRFDFHKPYKYAEHTIYPFKDKNNNTYALVSMFNDLKVLSIIVISITNLININNEALSKESLFINIKNGTIDKSLIEASLIDLGIKNSGVRVIMANFNSTAYDAINKISSYIIDNKNYYLINDSDTTIYIICFNTNDIWDDIISIINNYKIEYKLFISSYKASIQDIDVAFKEALISSEISKTFDITSSIIFYDKILIEKYIYLLSDECLNDYKSSKYYDGVIDLSPELKETALEFLNSNLNVTDTSVKLFIHRNTLIYRLDKIKSLTNLDIRQFNEALFLKVLLLINNVIAKKNL